MPRDPHAKQTTCGGRGQGPCLPCAGPGPGRGGAPAGLMDGGGDRQPGLPWGPQSRKVEGSPAAEQRMQYPGDHGRAAADTRAAARPGEAQGSTPPGFTSARKQWGLGDLKATQPDSGARLTLANWRPPPVARRTSPPAGEGARPQREVRVSTGAESSERVMSGPREKPAARWGMGTAVVTSATVTSATVTSAGTSC